MSVLNILSNSRTTIARGNRKLRPDLMMNNLVIVMISAWWSTACYAISGLEGEGLATHSVRIVALDNMGN